MGRAGIPCAQLDSAMRIVQAEECTRAACEELAASRQNAAQLENSMRAREREIERLTKQLGQSKGVEHTSEAQRVQVSGCWCRMKNVQGLQFGLYGTYTCNVMNLNIPVSKFNIMVHLEV